MNEIAHLKEENERLNALGDRLYADVVRLSVELDAANQAAGDA